MDKVKQTLIDLESVLDCLISNADKLCQSAKRVISREELTTLQNIQKDLLDRLVELDDKYHKFKNQGKEIDSEIEKRIHDKLSRFEVLNAKFISQLKKSFDIIHFNHKK